MRMNIINGFMKNIPLNWVKTMLTSLFIICVERTYYLNNNLVHKEQVTITNNLNFLNVQTITMRFQLLLPTLFKIMHLKLKTQSTASCIISVQDLNLQFATYGLDLLITRCPEFLLPPLFKMMHQSHMTLNVNSKEQAVKGSEPNLKMHGFG